MPPGFAETVVLAGVDAPDHLIFSPDGRMFISERITGRLLVASYDPATDRWQRNPQPFHTFPVPQPEPRRSGGLRGIAFDPDFAVNGYLYAFYMHNDTLQNRVVRLKARTDNADLADPTFGDDGEELLIDLPFNHTFASGSHNGGALEFGVDGKLYITTGDGWTGEFAGARVQSLRTFTGKVLRINPDGSIPTNNPFYNETTGVYRAIYALGLRNPYAVARHPVSGKLYINEARGPQKADIYLVEAGANYGHEWSGSGTLIGVLRTPWANAAGAGGELVTAGTWYPAGGPFPTSYHNTYLVPMWGGNEVPKGQLNFIRSETNTTVSLFLDEVGDYGSNLWATKPVMTRIGPDGNLYYMLTTYETDNGAVYRVRYTERATVQKPQALPDGGEFANPTSLTLTTETLGATIYYTLNGSEPMTDSIPYSGPINILSNTVVRARAFYTGMNPSRLTATLFLITNGTQNEPPIIDAGPDLTVFVGDLVTLDGSGSIDPDGPYERMYDEQWTQLSGPSVEIIEPTEEIAYFIPTVPGTYEFALQMRDEQGALGADTVLFTVLAAVQPGDCNGDDGVDAGDLTALVLEVFDDDGSAAADASGSTFAGSGGCDANQDTRINAGDLSCTVLLIFEGADACGPISGR